ncbi:MAG: ribonuclease HI [Treponema sp.]
MKAQVRIYTDGACSKNPGPGGWAFVIILHTSESAESEIELCRGSGSEQHTTNNRMELQAVIQALSVYRPHMRTAPYAEAALSIHTDSQYVQQGISSWIKAWKKNGWKTAGKQAVKNQDLWQLLDTLATDCKPQWIWVKGHAGDKYNELCDSLATAEIQKKSSTV